MKNNKNANYDDNKNKNKQEFSIKTAFLVLSKKTAYFMR